MMNWRINDIGFYLAEAKAAGFHPDLLTPADRMIQAMRALQDTFETGIGGRAVSWPFRLHSGRLDSKWT